MCLELKGHRMLALESRLLMFSDQLGQIKRLCQGRKVAHSYSLKTQTKNSCWDVKRAIDLLHMDRIAVESWPNIIIL